MSDLHRRRVIVAVVAGSLVPLVANSEPSAFPIKPITLKIGYAPGGSADATARLVAQGLTKRLGQTVIVENQPGASGNIAGAAVAHSPADGYTLFLGSNATTSNVTLYRNMGFKLDKDLTPVGMVNSFPNMLVVTPTFPAKSVAEFIAYAKAHPGQINMASSGSGSSMHLAGELFSFTTGIKMTHVPYRGSGPAQTDMMAGNVQVIFDNAPSILPLVQSGKLRALAVTSSERQKFAPDLPTLAESGLPGFVIKSWYGIWAPAATPASVVQKLNGALNATLADPDTVKRFAALGATAEATTSQSFGDFAQSEVARWGDVVRKSGATVD